MGLRLLLQTHSGFSSTSIFQGFFTFGEAPLELKTAYPEPGKICRTQMILFPSDRDR